MASKNTALRNLLADAFGDAYDDAGGGVSNLEIYDASDNLLVSFDLNSDAFAAASTGTISLNGLPKTTQAGATGTADHADLVSVDGGGTTDYTLTGIGVAESGQPITIDNADINSGQDVTLESFDYTEASTTS